MCLTLVPLNLDMSRQCFEIVFLYFQDNWATENKLNYNLGPIVLNLMKLLANLTFKFLS